MPRGATPDGILSAEVASGYVATHPIRSAPHRSCRSPRRATWRHELNTISDLDVAPATGPAGTLVSVELGG